MSSPMFKERRTSSIHKLETFTLQLRTEIARVAIALTPPTVPPSRSLDERLARDPNSAANPASLLSPVEEKHLGDARIIVDRVASIVSDYERSITPTLVNEAQEI